jgi:hypothetical protein
MCALLAVESGSLSTGIGVQANIKVDADARHAKQIFGFGICRLWAIGKSGLRRPKVQTAPNLQARKTA